MSIPYADNIVFNLTYYNDNDFSAPAEIYLNRDQAFIDNIENYYIRLLGAEISTSEIPLFTYRNDMSVRIVNSTVVSDVAVSFDTLYATFPNDVVFIQQFLNGVNAALKEAHNNTAAPGNPPLFVFLDNRMRLIIDQAYDPNIVSIGVNPKLSDKLLSFMSSYDGISEYYYLLYGQFGINLFNTFPGGINYPVYVINAGSDGFSTLLEYTSLVITTSSIPINKQQLSTPGISTRTLGILDIIPLSIDDINKYSTRTWTPGNPTFNDLLSRGKLSEMDFKIFMIDKNFITTPLLLLPKTSATCRIEFVNKEIVKNYYPSDEKNSRSHPKGCGVTPNPRRFSEN